MEINLKHFYIFMLYCVETKKLGLFDINQNYTDSNSCEGFFCKLGCLAHMVDIFIMNIFYTKSIMLLC